MLKIIFLFYLFFSNNIYAEKIYVITHKDNIKNVQYREVKHYYSGIYFDFPISDNRSIQELFYKKLLSKDMDEVKKMWGRILFSGKGDVPVKLSKDREVINWVSQNPKGIGYIREQSFNPKTLGKVSEF